MPRPPLLARVGERLASLADRLIDARERCGDWLHRVLGRRVDALLGVLDSFEALEAGAARAIRVLLWPLTGAARWLRLDRLLYLVLHAPALAALAVGAMLRRAARLTGLEGGLDRGTHASAWLLAPAHAALAFARAWGATRRPRDLALAAPAIVALLPFVWLSVAGRVQGTTALAERYRVAAQEADERGDPELADLMRRKLEQLGVSTGRADFLAAARLIDRGAVGEGYRKLTAIAPLDAAGFAPAHFMVAQLLLSGRVSEADEPALTDERQRLLLAERRLDQVASLGVQHEALAISRAYVMGETGRPDDGAALLAPYADNSFRAAGMRLRLLVRADRHDEAIAQAQQVIELFNARPADDQPDAQALRWRLLAADLLGDAAVAEQALIDLTAALDTQPANPMADAARVQLVQLTMRVVDATLGDSRFDAEALAARLIRAQRMGCPPSWLNQRVERVVARRRASESCREVIAHLIAAPDAPGEALEVVGTIAASHGEITQARKAFRRLTKAGAASPVVWNNLAWTLLREPLPEHAAALAAVEQALAADPTNARFLETRGQAYVRLKRWDEAIVDLRLALNALPHAHEAHAALAQAYEAVGEASLAEAHRLVAAP